MLKLQTIPKLQIPMTKTVNQLLDVLPSFYLFLNFGYSELFK